ncbi:MAG: hypothetical protein A2V93_00855 [Ignavibacteria bacterium RBG_16_34_14]|nr:MAG: hypothetical protein A2V93_00855 [Ignavibacteria bacterium RBG_16_34_14]
MNKSTVDSSIKTKERNRTADLAKGLAIVFMVQVHVIELFAEQEIFKSAVGKISLFVGGPSCAPVFMAVMGYFVYLSKKSWAENSKRGLTLIIGGLILNIGLNLHLLIRIYNGELDINPWHYVFGADILPLAGLSVIALAFLKKIFNKNLIPYIVAIPLILFLSHLLPDLSNNPESPLTYIQAFFYGRVEWSYFPFFPWFIYPLAGFIFSIISKEYSYFLNSKLKITVIIISGIIILFTLEYGLNISHDLQSYYHHNEVFVLWVFAFLVIWIFCLNFLLQKAGNNILWKYLTWLGKNVTAVYVFQWLVIGNIATSVYKTQSLIHSVIWFIGIMSVVSIFVYLYDKYLAEKLTIKFSFPL